MVKTSSCDFFDVKIFQASNPKSFFPSILLVPRFALLNPPYLASVAASPVNCKSTSNDLTIDVSDNTENLNLPFGSDGDEVLSVTESLL